MSPHQARKKPDFHSLFHTCGNLWGETQGTPLTTAATKEEAVALGIGDFSTGLRN